MRYVEEAGKVIAQAVGLKDQGKPRQALDTITDSYSGLLELDRKILAQQPEDKIVGWLESEFDGSAEQIEACGLLLFWEGKFLLHAGDVGNAEICFRKALRVLKHIQNAATIYSVERAGILAELRGELIQK